MLLRVDAERSAENIPTAAWRDATIHYMMDANYCGVDVGVHSWLKESNDLQ